LRNYQYLSPETLNEALSIMEHYGGRARPLLGGTDLLVRIQKGQAEPEAVVDLKRVRDIDDTSESGQPIPPWSKLPPSWARFRFETGPPWWAISATPPRRRIPSPH
jgi:hypothetical protein